MIEDYKKRDGRWAQTYRQEGTRSYVKWRSMLSRCKAVHTSYATYKGCTVSPMFSDFQSFTEWHLTQVGYGTDYHLDKDLLVPHGTVYSEGVCVLLPPELNLFIRPSVARKGSLPQGVSYDPARRKYVAGISHKNESIYVGRFDSVESAREAYCQEKDRLARLWAERLEAGEFTVDPRVTQAMKDWKTDARYY